MEKSFVIEMTDVDTSEVLTACRFNKPLAPSHLYRSVMQAWLGSFIRGVMQGRNLDLHIYCRDVEKELDLFKVDSIKDVY